MGNFRLFSLAAMVLLMRCLVVSLAIPTSNFTDQSALLVLKAHVTSDPFGMLTRNWSTAISFCHWHGVTCSARHQRVGALDLSHMNLQGTIPPQLGNLSFLVSLALRNNSFHGDLPNEIANLRRLKSLNLENNRFGGQIPSTLGALPLLQELNIGNNSITGTMPPSLFNITTLEILRLYLNFLQGNVPEEVSKLSNVRILHIGYNQLSGHIPSTLCNCGKVQLISLSDNTLTGSIPSNIGNLTNLWWLNLRGNELSGEIPPGIEYLVNLNTLGLEGNSLTGTIPREIGKLQNLENLFLHRNNLIGAIPSALWNLSTIILIELNDNHISGNLPSSIGFGLPNLRDLFVANNNLSRPIPDSICNVSQLVYLELSHNSFSGFIPDCLGNLRDLLFLNFRSNLLTVRSSYPEMSFLSSLANCKNLTKLDLTDNPLHSRLPESIGNLSSSLQHFYIGSCKIRGSLPREIGNLSNAIEMNLEENELTGVIPTTLGRLQNLQGLFLGGNRLQGSIPPEICQMNRLAYLSLFDNKLQGPIMACLANLTSLTELHLAHNRLTGTIPSTLWGLQNMLRLNLSSNALSGSLPLETGNLKAVTVIDVSTNYLSGNIPGSIGGLRDLTNLSLSSNRLQGQISESFGDLVGLEFLDLSKNNLSGVIPKSLEKLRYLTYFNVSFNQLEGEIPSGGAFPNLSAESFAENKALCGSILMQVSPCPQHSKTHSKSVLRIILPTIGSTLLLLVSVAVSIKFRYHGKNAKLPTRGDVVPLASWRRISYNELRLATNGFQESNLIGAGSFGSVYKGTLADGKTVAVKVCNLNMEGAFTSFDTECEVLRNIRHRNLVKIISCCSKIDFKALVLEFMPNWSLEKWLYSDEHFLDFLQRLNIMIDVASALEYLHHDYSISVVHCDLKPSNVLLDGDLVAHLSDFGISKLLGEGYLMTRTSTLATVGYMAPEYGSEGIVTVRGDIYSYGILLMETFTGRKPTDEMFDAEISLKDWIKECLPNAVTQVADANLLRRNEQQFATKKECMVSILELALACSADLPEERLSMRNAVALLKKIKTRFLSQRNY